jgi:hypothetical protein
VRLDIAKVPEKYTCQIQVGHPWNDSVHACQYWTETDLVVT